MREYPLTLVRTRHDGEVFAQTQASWNELALAMLFNLVDNLGWSESDAKAKAKHYARVLLNEGRVSLSGTNRRRDVTYSFEITHDPVNHPV